MTSERKNLTQPADWWAALKAQTPEEYSGVFFVFFPNTLDFTVKIVDNPNTRVTKTSDKHNSHERPER